MDRLSLAAELRKNAPKVFTALARFLDDAQLAWLAFEYFECDKRGGNIEQGMTREAGVSFNPRMARLLSLLIVDGRVRDFDTLRAALYAASRDSGLSGNEGVVEGIPQELADIVSAVWSRSPDNPTASLIWGVIELDSLRHLHQTDYSHVNRLAMIAGLERLLCEEAALLLPEWLRKKLEHAITLQRRHAERH